MKIKILSGIGFIFLLLVSTVSAHWDKKPQFRWLQLYRYDLRRDNHQLYTHRLSLVFNYLGSKEKSLFGFVPFFEIRRNIDKNLWERKELGVEIGKDIFSWLYLGQIIQKGWIKEDYRSYADYEKRDYTESETRLMLSYNFFSNKYFKLRGFLLNEFTYDFDKGAGRSNELAAGFRIPVGKYIETDINWRHIDRIHYYDSDSVEIQVTLAF